MKTSKSILIMLVMALLVAFVGCSGKDDDTGSSTGSSSSSGSSSKAKDRVTLVVALDHQGDALKMKDAMAEIVTWDKYSHVDFDIRPTITDFPTAMPIQVAGGEQMDIVAIANPILLATWARAGILLPLDKYAKDIGLSYDTEFGQYKKNAQIDGDTYLVPNTLTKWGLYYNKDLFDAVGEPYPSEDIPMTWDEYTELADRLTHGEGGDKMYGALQLTWPMYWYGEAIMALGGGEYFYNEEGLSNIEDPIFAKALERTYQMQHIDKSTPTHADIVASKTLAPAFMSGRYAMNVAGGWILGWADDDERYPRDWKLGIAPMPVDTGTTTKSWGVVDGFGIPASSKHPELAFEFATDLVKLAASYAQTTPSAAQVDQPSLYKTIGEALTRRGDGIDTALIQKIFANPETIFVSEKVTGPNNNEYERVIDEEVEKYFVQAQDLETTIKNIKTRGDKVILGK